MDNTSSTESTNSLPSIDEILDREEDAEGKPAPEKPAKADPPEEVEPEEVLDDEDDEFGDFEVPTDKLPKDEEKKEPEPEKKDSEKKEPEKPEAKKAEEKPPEKPAEKAPEKPKEAPKTVKVKIAGKEHEIPEEVADHWEKVAARAKELTESTTKLRESLFSGFREGKLEPGRFSATSLDLLTEEFGGDREKAHEALLREYATVLKREIDFRSQPEDTQKRILAEQKAAHLEAQIKAQEDARKSQEDRERRTRFIEKCADAIVGTMRDMGLAIKPENREIYDRALRDLELAAVQKKGLTRMDVQAIVKNAKGEVFAQRDRLDAESKRRVEELSSLADDVFEKQAEKFKPLIERLRSWDAKKLKEERAAKKAESAQKKDEPEPKRSTAFKPRKTMNAAEWAREMG